MPLTLYENTLLLADSNYFENSAIWAAATDAIQEEALIFATEQLNRQVFLATGVDANQPLAWPRVDFSFYDPIIGLSVTVPTGTIPVRLAKAVALLAIHYVQHPELASGTTVTYDRIKVGPIELENSSSDGSKNSTPEIPMNAVIQLIGPLLDTDAPSYNSRVWWRAN